MFSSSSSKQLMLIIWHRNFWKWFKFTLGIFNLSNPRMHKKQWKTLQFSFLTLCSRVFFFFCNIILILLCLVYCVYSWKQQQEKRKINVTWHSEDCEHELYIFWISRQAQNLSFKSWCVSCYGSETYSRKKLFRIYKKCHWLME